jgi:hypothetical protein
MSSGCSVQVKMSLGRSVGGRSIKAPIDGFRKPMGEGHTAHNHQTGHMHLPFNDNLIQSVIILTQQSWQKNPVKKGRTSAGRYLHKNIYKNISKDGCQHHEEEYNSLH